MSSINTTPDADEILIAFHEAGPTANTAEWMRQYPTLAGDLARCAANRWAGGEADSESVDAAAVARLRALGRETVRSCRLQVKAAVPATPLTGLIAAAKARGMDAQTLASRLEVPYALLFKLHRRLIIAESIPRALVTSMADALGRTADEIAAYLRQPATLAHGASYRADDTPTPGAQESFVAALQIDPDVTEAQRNRWLSHAPEASLESGAENPDAI